MKVRYITEGFFKNPEEMKAKREKEASTSNADKLAKMTETELKKKVFSTFMYVIEEYIKGYKNSNTDQNGKLMYDSIKNEDEMIYNFFGGLDICDIFYDSERHTEGIEPDTFTISMNYVPYFDFEYDIDIHKKRITITPYWRRGSQKHNTKTALEDLNGDDTRLSFLNNIAAQKFYNLFLQNDYDRFYGEKLHNWTKYWVLLKINYLDICVKNRNSKIHEDLEMLKEYDFVMNKIVVGEGTNKNITIDLIGFSLVFNAEKIEKVKTWIVSTFCFATAGVVSLRYFSEETARIKTAVLAGKKKVPTKYESKIDK